jgi:hypothetical protein
MPRYFHWRSPDINWDSALESHQCLFIKKNGKQCRRHCVVGIPYCYSHLYHNNHLYTAPSTIPNAGLGLFTSVDIPKGTVIVTYDGKRLSSAQLQHLYGDHTAPYAISISAKKHIDAALERGAGALINHNPRHANVSFHIRRRDGKPTGVNVVALKNIRADRELFVSYGRSYRLHERGVQSWTDACKHGC